MMREEQPSLLEQVLGDDFYGGTFDQVLNGVGESNTVPPGASRFNVPHGSGAYPTDLPTAANPPVGGAGWVVPSVAGVPTSVGESIAAAIAQAQIASGSLDPVLNPQPSAPTEGGGAGAAGAAASGMPAPITEAEYLAPYQNALSAFSMEEASILQNLAEQYGLAREAQQERRDRGAGEIADAARIAGENIGLIQDSQTDRQAALSAATNAATGSINDQRTMQQQQLLEAVQASGGDVSQIAGTLATGNDRVAREQAAGVRALSGLQELGQQGLEGQLGTVDLVQQSSDSALANNFAQARAALAQAELQSVLDVESAFAEQRRELEFEMGQAQLAFRQQEYERALEAERARQAARRSGGGGGSIEQKTQALMALTGVSYEEARANVILGTADNVANDFRGAQLDRIEANNEPGEYDSYYDLGRGAGLHNNTAQYLDPNFYGEDTNNPYVVDGLMERTAFEQGAASAAAVQAAVQDAMLSTPAPGPRRTSAVGDLYRFIDENTR